METLFACNSTWVKSPALALQATTQRRDTYSRDYAREVKGFNHAYDNGRGKAWRRAQLSGKARAKRATLDAHMATMWTRLQDDETERMERFATDKGAAEAAPGFKGQTTLLMHVAVGARALDKTHREIVVAAIKRVHANRSDRSAYTFSRDGQWLIAVQRLDDKQSTSFYELFHVPSCEFELPGAIELVCEMFDFVMKCAVIRVHSIVSFVASTLFLH
jgi:hypothetical protein